MLGLRALLSDLDRRLYLACDAINYVRQLSTSLNASEESIEAAAAKLIDLGLRLRDGDRLLSLAIPVGEYAPGPQIVDRFRRIARQPAFHPYAVLVRDELRSALKRRQL